MVNDPEIAELLRKMNERSEVESSAFNEVKSVGTESQEASSTTHEPNFRFLFILNGKHLNSEEVANNISHAPPLYKATLQPGDTLIARGAERNAYTPGFEAVAGSASQTQNGTDEVAPEGLTVEEGYAQLQEGVVQSDATFRDQDKEGFVSHTEREVQDIRAYRSGQKEDFLEKGNWQTNIIDDDDYEWDLSEIIVKRWVFDLYGAGEGTLFGRLRSTEANAKYVKIGTISNKKNPPIEVFNLPVSSRFDLASDAPEPVDVFIGPKQFLNRKDDVADIRRKRAEYREVSVSATIGSPNVNANNTVIRIYRYDPDKVQAAWFTSQIGVEEAGTSARISVREVHPDYITFPAGFDESDPSNWRAPGDIKKRETAVEEAKLASGEVTLGTYTDSDGVVKPRGEQTGVVSITANNQTKTSAPKQAELESFASEYNYVVLLGQVGDTTEPVDKIDIDWKERW